jgi:hypothetical protein
MLLLLLASKYFGLSQSRQLRKFENFKNLPRRSNAGHSTHAFDVSSIEDKITITFGNQPRSFTQLPRFWKLAPVNAYRRRLFLASSPASGRKSLR